MHDPISPVSARMLGHASAVVPCALAVFLPPAVGLRVDWPSFWLPGALVALVLACLLYARHRGLLALQPVLEVCLLSFAVTVPVVILSYCAVRVGWPLADQQLVDMDRALAFDVRLVIAAVGRRPWLADLLSAAYGSFIPQLIALPLALAGLGRSARAHQMIAAFVGISLVSITVSVFFPALATFRHLQLDATTLGAIDPALGVEFLDSFAAARASAEFTLSFGVASGIVNFPSMHAGMAVLCAWAAAPLRGWRVLVLFLNALMFASAVTHGAHYIVDVLAGGLVAAFAIMAVRRLTEPSRALSARPAAPASAAAARSA